MENCRTHQSKVTFKVENYAKNEKKKKIEEKKNRRKKTIGWKITRKENTDENKSRRKWRKISWKMCFLEITVFNRSLSFYLKKCVFANVINFCFFFFFLSCYSFSTKNVQTMKPLKFAIYVYYTHVRHSNAHTVLMNFSWMIRNFIAWKCVINQVQIFQIIKAVLSNNKVRDGERFDVLSDGWYNLATNSSILNEKNEHFYLFLCPDENPLTSCRQVLHVREGLTIQKWFGLWTDAFISLQCVDSAMCVCMYVCESKRDCRGLVSRYFFFLLM